VPAGLDQSEIREALSPERFVRARTLTGGTAESEARRQGRRATEALERDEATARQARERLARAAERLEAAIDAILAAPAANATKGTPTS
jgi:hypothetical protein